MMSESELRAWARSLDNIPACWPVRDAILLLLNGPKKAQSQGEDGLIAEGAGAVIRMARRVAELEKLFNRLATRLDGLEARAKDCATTEFVREVATGAGKSIAEHEKTLAQLKRHVPANLFETMQDVLDRLCVLEQKLKRPRQKTPAKKARKR